jgi:hypothetical protein
MLEERRLTDWDIQVKLLCVWNFGDSNEPPYRHLWVGESTGTCRYFDKTIVVGIHPDMAESDYEKNVQHLVGSVVAAKSATALGKRLFRKYGLKGWKLIVTGNLGEHTTGLCRPVKKEIYLDPYKLDRPQSSVVDTILHEIAHALGVAGRPNGHGPKWQNKAREFGVSDVDIAWHAKFGSE